MELQKIYIAHVDSDFSTWIDVNTYNKEHNGRNCAKFNSTNPVYIITIAKKISNVRDNLIIKSPNQYSYENIDWK